MNPSVTRLLNRVEDGDEGAAEELYRLVYADLRERAGRVLGNRPADTLQATALVHEAWLKLEESAGESPRSRSHFFGVAAKAMRSVLVDRARAGATEKRGGGRERRILDEAMALYEERAIDVVALSDALDELAEMDARLARIVELRFFGGLSIEETAEALGVGHATVERGWTSARAFLRGRLGGADTG